ncbi:MAG: hypothetical protein DMG64_17710 [Acidobacteria bacterium]|nr:MAG: hypothetical protein DMG64_17710 [Acidobacteriota bacterium]
MEDDGDPHRLAPSRSFSFVFEFLYKEVQFGGIMRQVATQGAFGRRLRWGLSDWHSYSISLTRLFWLQGRRFYDCRITAPGMHSGRRPNTHEGE